MNDVDLTSGGTEQGAIDPALRDKNIFRPSSGQFAGRTQHGEFVQVAVLVMCTHASALIDAQTGNRMEINTGEMSNN